MTVSLFILSAIAVLAVNMYFRTMSLISLDRIVDSRVLDDGRVCDIANIGNDYECIRLISPDGKLLATKVMRGTDGSMFYKREVIGLYDGGIYLYEWDYNAMNYGGTDEWVLRLDLETGTVERLYYDAAPRRSYISPDISNGVVYIARSYGRGDVRKVYLTNGDVEDAFYMQPPRDVSEFSIDGSGNIIITSPDSSSWISNDGQEWQPYDKKHVPEPVYAIAAVPVWLLWDESMILPMTFAVTSAWYLCIVILHFAYRRRTPLLIKQILVFIPVTAIGLGLMSWVFARVLDTTVADQVHNRLLTSGMRMVNTIDADKVAAIDWEDPFNDEYYCWLREYLLESSRGTSYRWAYDGMTANGYTGYWLYYVKDGQAYVGACDYMTIGAPMDDVREASQKMIATGLPTYADNFDVLGEGMWLNVCCPIVNSDGEVVALIEASESMVQSTYAFSTLKLGAEIIRAVIMISELLVFIVILGLTLKSLRKLKLGALAVVNGNYKYTVVINTKDELSDIADAFNQMSGTVESSIADISRTSEAYSYFVPEGMFSFLGKSDVLGVKLGDCAKVRVALLVLRIHNFESYRRREDLFEFLNVFFSLATPIITKNGGIVERYSENGLSAIFAGVPADALRAAEEVIAATPDIGCCAAVDYEQLLLGVIGGTDRMSVKIVSKHMADIDIICSLGEKLGSGVVVTQSAWDEAVGGSRFLGYFSANGELFGLYEVLRCSPDRAKKEEMRDSFHAAVSLYYNNDFYGARNGFIDVIKRAPGDLAAREYLLMSDRLHLSGAEKAEPLLEV